MKTCSIPSCERKSRCWSYCNTHYHRARRTGNVAEDKSIKTPRVQGRHPLYNTWSAMKTRCSNPNQAHYKHYGGRGIEVCDRWNESFDNFLEDMGEKPPGATLDRVNVDGNYSPENCRWADITIQRYNTRPRVTKSGFRGVTKDKNRWRAAISINGKKLYLGAYSTPVEAYEAYAIRREALGYD